MAIRGGNAWIGILRVGIEGGIRRVEVCAQRKLIAELNNGRFEGRLIAREFQRDEVIENRVE